MKNIRPALTRNTRLFVIIAACALVASLSGTRAFMQTEQQEPQTAAPAERVAANIKSKGTTGAQAKTETVASSSQDFTPLPLAPSSVNYSFSTTTTASLTDMSSGTTTLIAADQDDVASAVTLIGFDFFLNGARQDRFSVNSNGSLRFGPTAISTTLYDPLGQAGQSLITAYGADQRSHAGNGKVHFKVIGSAPNRVLVVEWLNMQADFNSGGTADLTYQVRLSETSGNIEFVYGSMSMSASGAADPNSQSPQMGFATNNAVGTVGSITAAQSGTPAPTFDGGSATPANNLYTAGTIPVLTSAANGSRRSFLLSPPAANPPGGPLTFTGVSATGMTLNWTDSSNETGYFIYVSTDGTNFTFLNTAAQDATSFGATGLLAGTTYFWRVYAVTEGGAAFIAGSQTTNAATPNTSLGSGLWSSPATWSTGSVPTANDAVTIAGGTTVTIDTAAVAYSVSVAGTLQFEQTTARTLNAATDVTVQGGGTFQSNPAGTQTGHTLSVGGNLTNSGTLDFSTNADTAGAIIAFTGSTNATFSGTGATTDVRQITMNKGTTAAPMLELNTTNFTVRGVTTDTVVGGWLVMTNGTIKISGTFAGTSRVFSAAGYTIPAAAGFWLNNPNYTVAGQNGSPTNSGLLRITQGTFNIGTATGNSMGFSAGSTTTVEGGAVNATGRFGVAAAGNAITYTQTGGTITVCTIGNASATLGSFDLGTSLNSNISMSGGTVVTQLAATAIDYRNQAGGGIAGVTGGTLQLGNAASGAAKTFNLRGVLPNVTVTNTSANHTGTMSTTLVNYNNASLNVNINTGATFNIGNVLFLMAGTTLTNNGTLTANGASSNFIWFDNGQGAQTYTGGGVTTAPVTSTSVQTGVSLTFTSTSQWITNRVNLFTGNIVNANKITLGNGGATTGVVQIGNTTTPTAAGTFDAAPTFNLGTGGQIISYLRTTNTRTTGPEINPTRTLTSMTYDDNDPTHALTIAGGDLTSSNTATALTLTNGRVITNANTLILSSGTATVTRTNGYVDGNFRKVYSAAGSKTFEVGTANGFSPVVVNSTAGTYPGDFTVKATQGQMPQISGANALQRYWTLSNNITGNVANLTFNYLATDVVGTAANYVFVKNNGGTLVNNIAPASPPTTTQATINGVSSFSDWTLAEAAAVQSGAFRFSSATYSDSETNSDHTFNAVVNRVGGSDGNVSVDFQVTDGTATVSDGDYTVASPTGTLNWSAGDSSSRNVTITVKGDTKFEPDETVNFQLNNPQGGPALGTPNSAVLTITNDDTSVSAGQLLISEFRLRGPGGASDEFIEIYNNTDSPHTVGATDASAGYGVAASDGVLRCTIPNGTVIPARGHFLCVNSVGYSLGNYPSGNSPATGIAPPADGRKPKQGRRTLTITSDSSNIETGGGSQPVVNGGIPTPEAPTASGDATYTADIPDNAGIALFSSTTTFTLANRLDAAGSTSEADTLYREGGGYPALSGATYLAGMEYAFVRDNCGKGGSTTILGPCPAVGIPKDTDDNAADFYFVDTSGASAGAGQRLGAPGPENLSSPVQRNSQFAAPNLDSTFASSVSPNRVRDTTQDAPNNSAFGTLDIRKRIVNNTGAPVTRLRFRVVDLTAFPASPAFAELRPRSSTLVVVSGINDATTCFASNNVATTPCTVNVQGTTLETPPSQSLGGGFNSTLSAGTVTLGTPLAAGASINVRFLLGIQQTGTFKFFINVEALP